MSDERALLGVRVVLSGVVLSEAVVAEVLLLVLAHVFSLERLACDESVPEERALFGEALSEVVLSEAVS